MSDSILVTGGAGFIGSAFVRGWLADPARPAVVVLDKLTYAGSRQALAAVAEDPRLEFVQGDINDRALVDQLLREHQPRGVVNFAAESHVDRSIGAPGPFIETNIVGTWQLLEASLTYWQQLGAEQAQRFRFLQASTDEVYGDLPPGVAAKEGSPYAPNSPYAAAKASADHLVRAYHHTYGLPTLITCSTNNYGPFQYPEKLIPRAITQAIAGEPIPIFGDGQQQRDWLYVDDACAGMLAVLDQGQAGEVYHLGSGSEQTNLDLMAMLLAEVDRQIEDLPVRPASRLIEHVADRPGHDRRYSLDISKSRQLGWEPCTSLAAGLAMTVAWYRDHRDWTATMLQQGTSYDRLGRRPT